MARHQVPHNLGLQFAIEMSETLRVCYEDHFTWLDEILFVCKESFARPEVELLPKTPSAKRGRKPLKKAYVKEDYEIQGSARKRLTLKESDDPPSLPRSTRVTRSQKSSSAEALPGSKRSTRSTRAQKRNPKSYSMVKNMAINDHDNLQDLDDDVDKTPVARQLNVILNRCDSTETTPQTTKRAVQRKHSVKDKARAYEKMLTKRTSQSPASSPRTPSSPIKNCKSVVTTPQTEIRNSAVGTPPTPDTVTQQTRSRTVVRDCVVRTSSIGSRRSSVQRLKVPASKVLLTSARGRASNSRASLVKEMLQAAPVSVEPEDVETPVKKKVRTRLRLKKKTDDAASELQTPVSSSSTSVEETDDCVPPNKKPCTETDSIVNTESRKSYDKLYKEKRESVVVINIDAKIDAEACQQRDRDNSRGRRSSRCRSKSATPEKRTEIKYSDVETVDVSLKKSTRTRTRKNAQAQKEAIMVYSESESDYERPVRQSTRTKTRNKTKQVSSASESGPCSSSSSKEDEKVTGSRKYSERDSGVVSAQSSDLNINVSAAAKRSVNVDVAVLEEGEVVSDSSPLEQRKESRKRQAEDELNGESRRPKRSCTNSEQMDSPMDTTHSIYTDSLDSFDEDRTPSPSNLQDTMGHPNVSSFLSSLRKPGTPYINSNIVTGITSFINKTSTTPNKETQLVLQKIRLKEMAEKQRRDQERIEKCKESMKIRVEEKKRKREERTKKVMEYRLNRDKQVRMLNETNAKTMEEKLLCTDRLKDEKLKETKEFKAKIRIQKQQLVDGRRKIDEEDKIRKAQEMEDVKKQQFEMMQRKKEFEEQERQRKIAEERRKLEEKQAEIEKEREAEKDRLMELEKEREIERKILKEEKSRAAAKERADRDRQELERKKERAIALNIEMEKLRELEKIRLQKQTELDIEKKRDAERVKEIIKNHNQNLSTVASGLNSHNVSQPVLNSTFNAHETSEFTSYDITPIKKRVEGDNYNIDDLGSDDSTDEEGQPRKRIPIWAQDKNLREALITQHFHPPNLDTIFDPIDPPDLTLLFKKHKARFFKRTSSAIWDSPIFKPNASINS